MMRPPSWVLFAAVAVVIVGVAVVVEGQRRQSLAVVAKRLDFAFTPGQQRLPAALDRAGFYLFTQGQPVILNLLDGQRAAYRVAVFDFGYEAGKGEEGSRSLPPGDVGQAENRLQVVVWLQRPGHKLPDFDLSPTRQVIRRVSDQISGMHRVGLDGRDAFSARYVLYGRDDAAVRQVFTPAVTGALAADPGWFVEGRGDQWLVYRLAERPAPGRIDRLLEQALGLIDLLAARPAVEQAA